MNVIAIRLETDLEGLPHVGIVIDDQNVRLTHFGTYLVIRKLWESIKEIPYLVFDILEAHFIAEKLYLDHWQTKRSEAPVATGQIGIRGWRRRRTSPTHRDSQY